MHLRHPVLGFFDLTVGGGEADRFRPLVEATGSMVSSTTCGGMVIGVVVGVEVGGAMIGDV